MPMLETVDINHALASTHSCVLTLWRGATTYPAVLGVRALTETVVARNSRKVGFLTVVEGSAAIPEGVTFAELGAIHKDFANDLACSAVVFEGTGFRATAVRAVTSAMNQLARQPFPNRIFSNLADAVEWMISIADYLKSEQVGDEFIQMRSALDLQQRTA